MEKREMNKGYTIIELLFALIGISILCVATAMAYGILSWLFLGRAPFGV
jgi:type II secretory pathway pseudopilin PulG